MSNKINKVVLAYSGGLDTSIILKWLQETYECDVVTFTADLGQGEEVEPARAKALAMGVPEDEIYIEDLREEFVRDYVYPMFRANTIYEGEYPEAAPDEPTYLELTYDKGDIVAIDGTPMSPAEALTELNRIGGANGIGRLDIVENRYVGMKSRGAYETPGGTIMMRAHRAIESITLDREAAHLKDELMPKYAKIIYNGYWWSPERRMLQAAIDQTQQWVSGDVRLKLYKGNITCVGRRSEYSLFDEKVVTFEEDDGAYNQADADGFIKLNALRLRTLASTRGEA